MEDREHGGYDTASREASVSGETEDEWELFRNERGIALNFRKTQPKGH